MSFSNSNRMTSLLLACSALFLSSATGDKWLDRAGQEDSDSSDDAPQQYAHVRAVRAERRRTGFCIPHDDVWYALMNPALGPIEGAVPGCHPRCVSYRNSLGMRRPLRFTIDQLHAIANCETPEAMLPLVSTFGQATPSAHIVHSPFCITTFGGKLLVLYRYVTEENFQETCARLSYGFNIGEGFGPGYNSNFSRWGEMRIQAHSHFEQWQNRVFAVKAALLKTPSCSLLLAKEARLIREYTSMECNLFLS